MITVRGGVRSRRSTWGDAERQETGRENLLVVVAGWHGRVALVGQSATLLGQGLGRMCSPSPVILQRVAPVATSTISSAVQGRQDTQRSGARRPR
ncbi:MAG: hypothetical protein IPO88_07940 [Nannocystis sp.]|uniref:hypothetical protein n=1 Tax=Nannocystis sp. TaxID=1962667 RepID=UPI0024294C70|nr:hypothetical protein [Nannocystis sp.]MBK9753425.1 hypothetical protein [Nannocystis sp.]